MQTGIFRVLRGTLVLVVGLALAGCNGSGSTDSDGDAGPLLEETTFDPHWGVVGVFSAATECTNCHRADPVTGVMVFDDGTQNIDVSQQFGWENSMMALAFADPYYQAAVEEEIAQFPHLAGLIEDTCLTCHAPMARTHAQQTGEGVDEDGYYRFETALGHMHAREGVSCTACHQIQDDGSLGTPDSFSGQYAINATTPDPEVYGPYGAVGDANIVAGPMRNNTFYEPVYREHMTESAMCATCHTLFTPTIGLDGAPTGGFFPEQSPYQEWVNSVYFTGQAEAAQCQDCHMPAPAGYSTQIAVRPDGSGNLSWPARTPFHAHGFVGGNTHTLEILLAFRSLLGIEGFTSVEGLDAQIEATRAQLENRTADIAIETVTGAGDTLQIPVRITNHAGHKLPTSFPSRRVWVHLKVTDATGATVFESGLPDAQGQISTDANALQEACVAGDKEHYPDFEYVTCYEPHRDVIADPAQVAIYESVLGDEEGDITYVLLYANEYLKDNRIPPKGFSSASVPDMDVPGLDGSPVTVTDVGGIFGLAATDSDFNDEAGGATGQDVVHYQVSTAGYTGPFTVEAELLYQSVRPGFVYGLHHDEQPRVARYKQMYEMIPPTVETLAQDQGVY